MTDRPMSFWAHLGELRTRLMRSALWVVLAAGIAYFFRDRIYALLAAPLLAAYPDARLNYFSPTEPFFVYIKLALYAGLVIASPLVLWELAAFVAPALCRRERALLLPVLPAVLGLFAAGVAFVYFLLLPPSLSILLGMAGPLMEAELGQERYFNFALGLCLAGGLLFELPVVLSLLGWLGIVSAGWLWRNCAYAAVVLMVVAAVITPTGDAFTMLALSVPMFGLYLLSIGLVALVQRRRPA